MIFTINIYDSYSAALFTDARARSQTVIVECLSLPLSGIVIYRQLINDKHRGEINRKTNLCLRYS